MSQNARNSKNNISYNSKDGAKKKLLVAILTTFVALLVVIAIIVFSEIGMSIARLSNNKDKDSDKQNSQNDTKIEYKNLPYNSSDVNIGELVLVNGDHQYTITSAVTDDLVNMYEYHKSNVPTGNYYYTFTTSYLKLNTVAMENFHRMAKDFVAQSGDNSLMVTSAFRTLEEQQGYQILPGYSEAHTGYILALSSFKNGSRIDLTPSDPVFSWIYDHAHEYGFVVRYPSDKIAQTNISNYLECFRYVGVLNAQIMKENNFCLEEYIDHLKKYTFEGEHFEVNTDDGSTYELYYVPASTNELTTIPVPANSDAHPYTISGTNAGGFVVSVKLK